MIQNGNPQPHPMAFPEGRPADVGKIIGRIAGDGRRSDDQPEADAGDALLFVSPPPAPWPRVFPGL
jgi:hypothetical protein